jgi:hypothetical protein
MQTVDANKDGVISRQELFEFLMSILGGAWYSIWLLITYNLKIILYKS